MSSARNYATDYMSVHFRTKLFSVACGLGEMPYMASVRAAVTCKRCLASLAKRDRAFQRKARGTLRRACEREPHGWNVYSWAFRVLRGVVQGSLIPLSRSGDAARAIAREEGRSV